MQILLTLKKASSLGIARRRAAAIERVKRLDGNVITSETNAGTVRLWVELPDGQDLTLLSSFQGTESLIDVTHP